MSRLRMDPVLASTLAKRLEMCGRRDDCVERNGINSYIEKARWEAAQCWCDEETSKTQMDPVLAEAFAKRLAVWMETAAMMSRNADFFRGLLDKCAAHLGREAYTADDGTVMEGPVRLKIPELVAKRCADHKA